MVPPHLSCSYLLSCAPCPRSFNINYRWFHDLSLAIFSELCVYANGRAADINIDSHRGGVWVCGLRGGGCWLLLLVVL